MAFQIIEGFDLAGSNAELAANGFAVTEGVWGAAFGKFGAGGYELPTNFNTNLSFSQLFAQRYNTVSFWWKNRAVTLGTKVYICGIDDALAPTSGPNTTFNHMYLSVGTDGAVEVFGDATSKGITSAGVISPNTYHHIEFKAHISSAGSVIVKIDGLEVANIAGDFQDAGIAYASLIMYGDSGVNVIDDLVVQSDTSAFPGFLDAHKIHTQFADADTAQADFVRSSGTNDFEMIDDPAGSGDGDGTYISSSTLNAKSEFAMTNLGETPATIHAVQVRIEGRKTDAGTKLVTPYIKSGATRGDGAEFAVSETYSPSTAVFVTDPNTAVAWTAAGVDAALLGVEITT